MRTIQPLSSLALGASCADIMKSLSDETRLRVVQLLLEGPKVAGALGELLGVDATLLSHHLRVLRETGLIERERQGRQLVYRVAASVLRRRRGNTLDFGCCTLKFEDGL